MNMKARIKNELKRCTHSTPCHRLLTPTPSSLVTVINHGKAAAEISSYPGKRERNFGDFLTGTTVKHLPGKVSRNMPQAALAISHLPYRDTSAGPRGNLSKNKRLSSNTDTVSLHFKV